MHVYTLQLVVQPVVQPVEQPAVKCKHRVSLNVKCFHLMELIYWRLAFTVASDSDCETVGIPPLMSRKTLGILDGGRGGGVDRSWRCRGIRGVDKGGA